MHVRRVIAGLLSAVAVLSLSTLSGTAESSDFSSDAERVSAQINSAPGPTANGTIPPLIRQVSGWQLVWADSFEGDSLDFSRWTPEWSTYGAGNGAVHCYRPENVVVENGSLHLVAMPWDARCPNGARRNYASGMVRTKYKVDWTYGRFEVDALIPDGQGIWPAAWLGPQGEPDRWPDAGEMDIFEIRGQEPNRVVGSAHWATTGGTHRLDNAAYYLPEGSFADGVHTYAMEWTPTQIVWSVDGIPYNWLDLTNLETSAGFGGAPFNRNFYLKLNLSVGGRWVGDPDSTTPWPADFRIDEIRVYQR